MKPDFSGWASKNDLLCSDGRTIKGGAFAHQNGIKVPLVWQHQHDTPDNVLGHAILENRKDGVYTQAFFNETLAGQTAKDLVKHGDVNQLSIFARQLVQKGKDVIHGNIKEVSLVLSGANPGAYIDSINLAHGDGKNPVEDEGIIYTGLYLSHSDEDDDEDTETDSSDSESDADDSEQNESEENSEDEDVDNDEDSNEDEDHTNAIESAGELNEGDTVEDQLEHADGKTVQDVYNGMSDEEQQVLHYLVGEAISNKNLEHSGLSAEDITLAHQEGFNMARNVFESQAAANGSTVTANKRTLSHSDIRSIFKTGERLGSLKEAFLQHADEIVPDELKHADEDYGVEDIDFLFPDARLDQNGITLVSRRTEWVANVLNSTKHSPFSRVKSISADLTAEEARAKGYVKGTRKKDEVIKLLKRVTGPKTIYKKQKLDRDDIIDIVDIDFVAWIKAEMRVMLDEEIARAILIGDGRDADDDDKIDEDHLRPIAWDDEMYTHVVVLDADATPSEANEAITRALSFYKGSGSPSLYTTQGELSNLLLDKDSLGRRFFDTRVSLSAALGVKEIIPVEVMEDAADVFAIIVNLTDYTVGADRGGEINFFDDFDIDFNQMKYLLETRISGALTKPKSAIVIKRNAGTIVTPNQPNYNSSTHVIAIPAQTGVIFSIDGVDKTAGNVTITEDTQVDARPAPGYSFPHTAERVFDYAY